MWGKHTLFERAARSPLIVSGPQVEDPGRKSSALVQSTDIYPTLIDLANPTFQQTHYPLDGKSLFPVIGNTTDHIRQGALTWWKDAVSVRTGEYRLISTFNEGEWHETELYDMSDGPDAATNIADDQPKVVKQLQELLKPVK